MAPASHLAACRVAPTVGHPPNLTPLIVRLSCHRRCSHTGPLNLLREVATRSSRTRSKVRFIVRPGDETAYGLDGGRTGRTAECCSSVVVIVGLRITVATTIADYGFAWCITDHPS